jgi:hypothetical protein
MPLINVKVIEGVFDQGQKREIVERLTDAMVAIEGEHMRGGHVVHRGGSRQRRLGNRRKRDDHRSGEGARGGRHRNLAGRH